MARVVKEHEGHNWRMDDPAGLHLSGTGELAEAPEHLTAKVIGRWFSAAETRDVELERLEYMAAGTFDPAVGRTWTGDYLKFAVYIYSPEDEYPAAFIMRADGSGSHYYLVDGLDSERLFRQLCASLTADTLWSLLSALVHSYEKGRGDEKARLYGLLLQGRLRKRKRRGGGEYAAELPEPPPPPPHTTTTPTAEARAQ